MNSVIQKIKSRSDFNPVVKQARAIRAQVRDDDITVERWLLRDWGKKYSHFIKLAVEESK